MTKPMADATLQDVWRLLGVLNKRVDAVERHLVESDVRLAEGIALLRERFETGTADIKATMVAGFGALKASIEARDFRLDEHGRRITDLELATGLRPPEET
jgi:hypothetical protein